MNHARSLFAAVFSVAVALPFVAGAQDDHSLTRDEVAQVKKKLVASLDALGQPPSGYSKESEHFNLPTEFFPIGGAGGRYNPVSASADRRFGTEQKARTASEATSKEYQQKIMEAQAKGDYAAMTKLSQELSQKISQQQLQATQSFKEPINVSVTLNSDPGATIDPDAVLFERPGTIALKSIDDNTPGKERVSVYVDPVALKSTKQLSRVDLRRPENGVAKRTAVLNITIELYGPAADVEAWAKRITVGNVLAQIDGGS